MLANNFDTWMILIGILINAAAPPLSAWLADAYPESSPTGSVFLSAFTTKTAVLALILLFPGEPVLIWIGLYMVMYGIIYALLENDARRILAYSIVNQVGFMVCAVGIGTQMALNGAAAHAFAHIIYKALLFMSAGVVVYRTGKSQVHRSRRAVPHHAADHDLRHHRRAVDLQFSADLGLHHQVHDLAGRRRRGHDAGLHAAGRGLGRRVPARRHQVSVVRVLPEGLRDCGPRTHRGTWRRQ